MNTKFNRFIYLAFLALGIYQSVIKKDYIEAASSFGIGLAFDPFDLSQKWQDRPVWQKLVLVIHLGVAAAMFGLGIGLKDK